MAKKKDISMLPLVAGIFLLILVFGAGGGRLARPTDDGTQNVFSLDYVDSAARAEVGDLFWVDVEVANTGGAAGSMWVQCSLLDTADHTWLNSVDRQSRASFVMGTSEADNCVAGEPFTQTARVTLTGSGNGSSEVIRYSVSVPNKVGADMQIYCQAYEVCYQGTDPLESDSFIRAMTVSANDNDDSNNNEGNFVENPSSSQGEACVLDMDCPNYFFGGIDCYEGYCMDDEDVPSTCGDGVCAASENKDTCAEDCQILSDFKVKEWIQEHKILVTGLALALIVIGGFGVYAPRKPLVPKF